MAGYDNLVGNAAGQPGARAEPATMHSLESLDKFQTKITIMVDIYARLHLRARFLSRTVLLITLSVSAVSAGMNLMTIWIPEPTAEVLGLLRVATIISLLLVVTSLGSTIWGLDQRASDCNYAFRRLMSIKTKLRVASREDARRMQVDYAEFGDDLPQIDTKTFTRLWDEVQKDRDERHSSRSADANATSS
jgi:hypothetical protein